MNNEEIRAESKRIGLEQRQAQLDLESNLLSQVSLQVQVIEAKDNALAIRARIDLLDEEERKFRDSLQVTTRRSSDAREALRLFADKVATLSGDQSIEGFQSIKGYDSEVGRILDEAAGKIADLI